MANKNYFGRGYIQLSWDYNYKAASHYLFGNEILIKNPDIGISNNIYRYIIYFFNIYVCNF